MKMERLATELFGKTEKNHCIFCKAPISIFGINDGSDGRIYSTLGLQEFKISGICETCFDKTTKEEDDDEYEYEYIDERIIIGELL